MDECEHDVDGELHLLKQGSYDLDIDDTRKNVKGMSQKESGKEPSAFSCPHQMGYLKTRSKDQGVPDSCLTCPKILQCMV